VPHYHLGESGQDARISMATGRRPRAGLDQHVKGR
jgi:hypothetical protein